MKCSECGEEIIDFPESRGFCEECETIEIAKILDRCSYDAEARDDMLRIVIAEMISRNMMDEI